MIGDFVLWLWVLLGVRAESDAASEPSCKNFPTYPVE